MNVAIIIPSLGFGGAERAAQLLGGHLSCSGHSISYFLTEPKKDQAYGVMGQVVNIKKLVGDVVSCNSIETTFKYVSVLRKEKKKRKIEVSVSFMGGCNYLNVLSKCGDRVILSVRTTLSARNDLEGLFYNKRIIRSLYNISNLVVAVSDYSRNDLIVNYGVRENKVITINNPVVFRSTITDSNWKYGKECVVCVGRYDPVKQQDRIIKAFSYVLQHRKCAKLILVGDGKTRDYLEYIADSLGIKDSVVFTGFTKDVGFYLSHARVYVSSSRAEGFPNAIVEAMAYNIPIISTDSPGGCKEILGGASTIIGVTKCEYGIMTPYVKGKTGKGRILDENEMLLGRAILELLSDKKLHEHYSAMSVERAKSYDYERIMKEWEDILL